MAGDWIQIDDDLPEKPEVQAIQDATGDDVEVVVGRIVRLWILVDRHAVALPESRGTVTGLLPRYQFSTVIRLCGGDEKFWESVVGVGWMTVEEDGLGIPSYSIRFGKSSKNRLLNARRQRNFKRRISEEEKVTVDRDFGNGTALSKEEKRRGENNKERAPAKFALPTVEEVRVYCRERGNHVDPERFVAHYQSNGWMVGRAKMKDWRAAVRTWEGNGVDGAVVKKGKKGEWK